MSPGDLLLGNITATLNQVQNDINSTAENYFQGASNDQDLKGGSTDDEYIFDRYSVRVIFIILYSIVFFLCFVGNLVVLAVVSLHWQMRHITKFCMANLAFADLCVGVFCVYQNLSTYLISSWLLGEFLCKMYQFINGLSHTASVLTLMVVSVERYLAIVHPLHCRQIMTKNRIRVVVGAVWLASGLYCSPRLYYMVTLKVPSEDGLEQEIICTARRTLYDSRTFDMINSILLFLLPLILMVVLYFRMGVVLRTSTRNNLRFPTFSSRSISNSLNERELQSEMSRSSGSDSNPENTSPRSSSDFNRVNHNFESAASTATKSFIMRKSLWWICGGGGENRESDLEKPDDSVSALQLRYRHGRREDQKNRSSVVKMMVVIVVVFAFCQFPYHWRKIAVYWWPNFDLGSVRNALALPVTNLCMYANCALNPIIYSFMSSSFRSCLKDLIFCRWRRPCRNNLGTVVSYRAGYTNSLGSV